MGTVFYRRFRMELDLADVYLPPAKLPDYYECLPWSQALLDRHAMAKYLSFHTEIDAQVFHCLGQISGCQRLMNQIASQKNFVPQATWLMSYAPQSDGRWCDCGTVQGLAANQTVGAIQNIGIAPEHRGLGLGRALLLSALEGFRQADIQRVYLEVTADNRPAVNLYRSVGFRLTRTMYKAVEVDDAYTYCQS